MCDIVIRPVTRDNWREVAGVSVRQDQEGFVAPVSYYLALCYYGGEWQPLALDSESSVVGFAMWAFDSEDESRWIGGVTIDAARQGRGCGRAAMLAIVAFLREQGAGEIALSYEPTNAVARGLYESIGFRETGETEGDEIVARLTLGRGRDTRPQ